MSSWGRKLISKAVADGHIEKVLSGGIDTRHFSDEDDEEVQQVWKFIKDHLNKYKHSPTEEIISERFPNYEFEYVEEPLEYVQDRFIIEIKRKEAIGAFQDLAEVLDQNDPTKLAIIDELFLDKAKDLAQVVPSANISRFSEMRQRIDLYRQRKDEGIQIGIPYGIPKLDEMTFGIQRHQFVTIAGWTGIGKSTLAMLLALNHYIEGFTPMFISLEMDEEEIYRKIDSMAVGLRQHAMKEMTLHPNDMNRWEQYAEKLDGAANDIIIVDIDFATPERVYAEVARWSPDVVFVDYIQLMEAPRQMNNIWERIGYISQMLKMQARQLKVPVYGLAQANADSLEFGADLSNLAGSKDIGRHSDLVLGLHQDQNMKELNKLDINVKKNRGGPLGTIEMKWDYTNCEFRQWRGTDAYTK